VSRGSRGGVEGEWEGGGVHVGDFFCIVLLCVVVCCCVLLCVVVCCCVLLCVVGVVLLCVVCRLLRRERRERREKREKRALNFEIKCILKEIVFLFEIEK